MADLLYNTGKSELVNGAIAYLTDTLKIMLVTSSYTPNVDDDVVDAGGANDPVDHEINVTGYTRGYGGAGRKTVTSKSINVNKTADRTELLGQIATWTALGIGATIAGAILIKEGGANDTTSRLIAYYDLTDTPTNGGDISVTWSGNILATLT